MRPTYPKLRVLLDVDGILADFITPVLGLVKQHKGIEVLHDHIKTWEIFESVPGGKEIEEEVYEMVRSPGFCWDIPAYEGAKEGLSRLMLIADVYFVTSPFPSPTWAHERQEWLREKMGVKDIRKRLISTSAKHVCGGDIFVDDKLENVINWEEHNRDGVGYLWDHNTNRSLIHANRLHGWDELLIRAVSAQV